MVIEIVNVSTLCPNDYNPNVHNSESFDKIMASLNKFGFLVPIIADERTKVIIDGEHRWRAAMSLGFKTVPVVFHNLNRQELIAATILMNRTRGKEDLELVRGHEVLLDDIHNKYKADVKRRMRDE